MSGYEGRHFVFLIGYIGQLGGAERQALLLAALLREREGAKVSFLGWSKSPGPMTDMIDEAGIPVYLHPLDWGHRLSWRRSRIAKAGRLAGFTRFARMQVKPDFLLPYVGENSKIAGLIWRQAGARYTWWNQRDEGREIHGSRLERWVLRTVPDVVSNSWEGKKFLIERFGLPENRVRVLNNAVPLPRTADGSEWRAKLGLDGGGKLMVMAANLTRYKDHDTLLHALKIVRQSPGAAEHRLALAGRPDDQGTRLKALAFDLGLGGSVSFLGPVDDMNPLYEAADLVVHSSVTEGCPNAVLEGMSHAKCVVGTDISGMRQALGDDNAARFLAPPRDAGALAERILAALGDDDCRAAAGRSNRERIAKEFSPEKHLASVLAGISRFALPG